MIPIILPNPPMCTRDDWNKDGRFPVGEHEPYRDPLFENIPFGRDAQEAAFSPYNAFFDPEYKKFAIDIVTESTFDFPYPYFTEKTLRPLASKRMFIMIGPCGLLARLRKQGFRTFDPFINESYDLIKDPGDRMSAVLEEIDRLCSISLDDVKEKMLEYKDILNYNQKHVQIFKTQQQEKDKICLG